MTQMIRRAALLAAALASPVFAGASPEALATAAAERFEKSAFAPIPLSLRPSVSTLAAQAQMKAASVAGAWDEFLRDSLRLPAPSAPTAKSPAQIADIDLTSLLNRQFKNSLSHRFEGRMVWCGAVFDLQQNGYLSVLVDGVPVRYLNIKDLLRSEKRMRIGSTEYKIRLAANVFNRLKSEIVFSTEDFEGKDQEVYSFTLKKMLEAVSVMGSPVVLKGQTYRAFYTDGVAGEQADPKARLFAFYSADAKGEPHLDLIPETMVPSDGIAVFKLFGDRPVGLSRQGSRLKVFENP